MSATNGILAEIPRVRSERGARKAVLEQLARIQKNEKTAHEAGLMTVRKSCLSYSAAYGVTFAILMELDRGQGLEGVP